MRAGVFRAAAVLMTTDAADNPTFAATTSQRAKTTAMLVMHLFEVDAFQGASIIAEIMNLAGAAQIINGLIVGVATDYEFFDDSYNAHVRRPFLRTRGWQRICDRCIEPDAR